MKTIVKHIIFIFGILVAICLAIVLLCNHLVVRNARGKVFDEIDSIEVHRVGLLLGTTPQTRIGGRQNMFFKFRIDAAEELYKAGKIEQILISGDENSLDGVNEPECMRDSLVARGIPAEAIYLDGKGFRTVNSVINTCMAFDIHSYIIISQRFHNERALYLAEHLGLQVQWLQAYNAKDPQSTMALMTYVREYFARVKMFLDLCNRHKYTASWTSQYNNCRGDKCPRCGSTNIGMYIYGLLKPAEEGSDRYEKEKKGLLIGGGCCKSDNSSKYRCLACGVVW